MYRQKYQKEQGGSIGIVLSTQYKEPLCDTNPADVAAAERNLQFYLGWFAAPIFKVRRCTQPACPPSLPQCMHIVINVVSMHARTHANNDRATTRP